MSLKLATTALTIALISCSGALASTIAPIFTSADAETFTSCDASGTLTTASNCSQSDAGAQSAATATTLKASAASTGSGTAASVARFSNSYFVDSGLGGLSGTVGTIRFEYDFDGYLEGPDASAGLTLRQDSKFGFDRGATATFSGDTYFLPQRDAFFAGEAGLATTLIGNDRSFGRTTRSTGIDFIGYRGVVSTEFDVVFGEFLNVSAALDSGASGRFFPGNSTSDFFSTAELTRIIAFDGDGNETSVIFNSFDSSVDLSAVDIRNRVFVQDNPTPVPLPAGFPLLLAGIAAFGLLRRR